MVIRRPVRPACRYRVPTAVVPAGQLVRHPRCPECGDRLAYRELEGAALHLHAHDPRYCFAVVR